MTANQAVFPVQAMARVLGVSRSGFHAWTARAPSARAMADGRLTERIVKIYGASKETYGAPRIHAELADEGIDVGRKRVERLMKAAALTGVSRRKGTRTAIRDDRIRPANDLVDRNFRADEPNQLWCGGHHLRADMGGLHLPVRRVGRLVASYRGVVDGPRSEGPARDRRHEHGHRPTAAEGRHPS